MRIAVLDDYQKCAERFADWSKVKSAAEVQFFHEPFESPDDVVAKLASFDVLCLMRERTPFPHDVLKRLRSLRHIVLTGKRSSTLDIDALKGLGISIDFTGAGPAAHATPELAFGLLLALARNIPEGDRLMKAGEWLENAPMGCVLHGKTLGLIGLGNVGTRVAEFATAFGMKVIAWSPNLTSERAAQAGVEFRSTKQGLLGESDFVSLHLVLADSTRGIVGHRELSAMKSTAFLINTGRGPLVEEEALVKALRGGEIAGAALDVYDTEPSPRDHPLRSLKNCVLLPHFGYVVAEIYEAFYQETVAALEGMLDI